MNVTETLQQAVEAQRERWNIPGIALGILQNGAVESIASGVTSLDTHAPVRPETLFQIGSISKVFCATLVMQLVDEGRLDLDAPIATYLSDIAVTPNRAEGQITSRQLLSHMSGLASDPSYDDSSWDPADDILQRPTAVFEPIKQVVPAGAQWTYSNAGFQLLGYVVGRVLGESFESAMRTRIVEPLGLTHTFQFAHDAIVHPRAVGHALREPDGNAHDVSRQWYPWPRWSYADGVIISNVADLLQFAAFHMGDGTWNGRRVLSEASIRAMQQPQARVDSTQEWGLGWALREIDGVRLIGHGGATVGFRALLTAVPEQGFALAILTNGDRGNSAIMHLEETVLADYCGLQQPFEPAKVHLSALERLAGRYGTEDWRIDVQPEGAGLSVQASKTDSDDGGETQYPSIHVQPLTALDFIVPEGREKGFRLNIIEQDGTPAFARVGGRIYPRIP